MSFGTMLIEGFQISTKHFFGMKWKAYIACTMLADLSMRRLTYIFPGKSFTCQDMLDTFVIAKLNFILSSEEVVVAPHIKYLTLAAIVGVNTEDFYPWQEKCSRGHQRGKNKILAKFLSIQNIRGMHLSVRQKRTL